MAFEEINLWLWRRQALRASFLRSPCHNRAGMGGVCRARAHGFLLSRVRIRGAGLCGAPVKKQRLKTKGSSKEACQKGCSFLTRWCKNRGQAQRGHGCLFCSRPAAGATWMIVVLAKQIGWMLSLCKSVVEDMYLQRLEIVTPTWLRIGWTYVGLTLSLLSPTWSCLLDLRR